MLQKHAFLIIAHQEFEILQRLVDALDCEWIDIFVHIDKRVHHLPKLSAQKSRLCVLRERRHVIWGGVEQVACELRLMRTAAEQGEYAFYHVISGVHYPLVSTERLAVWFSRHLGKSVLQPMPTSAGEVEMKLGLRHYFLRNLVSRRRWLRAFTHTLWIATLAVQKRLGMWRDVSAFPYKVSSWCSLSQQAVDALLADEEEIMRRLSHTFCCDEFFVPAWLERHRLPVVKSPHLLFQRFEPFTPKVLTEEDFPELAASGCLFARKFTRESLTLIERLKNDPA